MLIDGIGLEFQHVSTALNVLAAHDPLLWALGKIYTYRLQTTPFVHLDNDVFLWKRLPMAMETAPLLAQNPEHFIVGESHYKPEAFMAACKGAENIWVPAEWKWYYADGKQPQRGDQCGIFGGNHTEFINYYAELAIRLAEHPANRSIWSLLNRETGANNACGLFEEYLLSACIEYHRNTATSPYRNIEIEYLFGSMSEAYNEEHGARAGYTHMLGLAKQNRLLCDRLEQRIIRDYPEHYERCLRFESAGSMPRNSDKSGICRIEEQTPAVQQSSARTDATFRRASARLPNQVSQLMNSPTHTSLDLYDVTKLCERLWAQQRIEELCAVAGILIAAQPRHILEIGVYGGGSFALWCALASGKKIGIDNGSFGGPIDQRIAEFRTWFGEVEVIKGDSHHESTKQKVLDLLHGEPLDFLFIDGDHTLLGVDLDYEMYAPLVRSAGWIGFHDVTESDYHKGMNAGGAAEHWSALQHPRKIQLNWRDPGYGIGMIQMP
jgi:cephalosporin hydroxylase